MSENGNNQDAHKKVMTQPKKKLISIIGATATGKTKMAILAAKYFHTEIISFDSRQFYKEIPIGTAAPSLEELAEVKHHFVGNLSLKDNYSLGRYEHEVLEKLRELFWEKNIVIMAGGSGMYEKSVVDGLSELPAANPTNLRKLEELFQKEGITGLCNLLEKLDKNYWNIVDSRNSRRLIRAIDVIWQTGKTYTEIISKPRNKRDFDVFRIGISAPREIIYEKIHSRVEEMFENGLLEEARSVLPYRERAPLQTVGYRELFKYFDGEWDFDTTKEEIKKNTRRYAKRQMTWNRKLSGVRWIPYDYSNTDLSEILDEFVNSSSK